MLFVLLYYIWVSQTIIVFKSSSILLKCYQTYRDIYVGIFLPLGKQLIRLVPNTNKHTCKDCSSACNLIYNLVRSYHTTTTTKIKNFSLICINISLTCCNKHTCVMLGLVVIFYYLHILN